MIKRTIYFGNPTYLNTKHNQLLWSYESSKTQLSYEVEKSAVEEDDFLKGIDELHQRVKTTKQGKYETVNEKTKGTIPIEDIGIVILDHEQITISHALIAKLLDNNVALITCNATHHPTGLLLNLDGNTLQSQRFKHQIEASQPLKKQLWQQTIQAKIYNQAKVLDTLSIETGNMYRWSKEVKTADSDNHESQAAAYYWKKIFAQHLPNFTRGREETAPNNLLNYGYAILRAAVARSIVGSGLLPTLGIFHRNQYNAYCLADDIMEPYRPYVDALILHLTDTYGIIEHLNPTFKKELLQIPTLDVVIDGNKSPLLIAIQRTTASLAKCYEGIQRKIVYPIMQ